MKWEIGRDNEQEMVLHFSSGSQMVEYRCCAFEMQNDTILRCKRTINNPAQSPNPAHRTLKFVRFDKNKCDDEEDALHPLGNGGGKWKECFIYILFLLLLLLFLLILLLPLSVWWNLNPSIKFPFCSTGEKHQNRTILLPESRMGMCFILGTGVWLRQKSARFQGHHTSLHGVSD